MSDCVKALQEANGDLEQAASLLRQKGIAKMAKRSDRQTKEGVVKMSIAEDGSYGAMVEVDAETDFVVRSEKFQTFAEQCLKTLLESQAASADALLAAPAGSGTLKDEMEAQGAVFGEKLEVKNAIYCSAAAGEIVAGYSHFGGKVGSLVILSAGAAVQQEAVKNLAREIAMQVAAVDPRYLAVSEVPADVLASEKEIYVEELKNQGKPEAIWDRAIQGKLQKFYSDVCLLKQPNIREEKITIEQMLAEVSQTVGSAVSVKKFIRFQI
jgi:elongation factor Ts